MSNQKRPPQGYRPQNSAPSNPDEQDFMPKEIRSQTPRKPQQPTKNAAPQPTGFQDFFSQKPPAPKPKPQNPNNQDFITKDMKPQGPRPKAPEQKNAKPQKTGFQDFFSTAPAPQPQKPKDPNADFVPKAPTPADSKPQEPKPQASKPQTPPQQNPRPQASRPPMPEREPVRQQPPRPRSFRNPSPMPRELPSRVEESYKMLRTNLFFGFGEKRNKLLLVTSTYPKEGKNDVAVNLAISMSQTGAKVILVDCDLRKPSIHQLLRVKKSRSTAGLSTVITGQAFREEAIRRHPVYRFDYVLSGNLQPNPAELLESLAMRDFLLYLRETYDYVICVTPPAGAFTDAAVMSRYCDGTVLVVRQGYAQKRAVRSVAQRLRAMGGSLIGLVLTQYDPDKDIKTKDYPDSFYGQFR